MKCIFISILLMISIAIKGQEYHTEFNYDGLIIQNSYPKGGQKYSAPDGRAYVYVVFWSSITNKSDDDLELSLTFPTKRFSAPASPDVFFNLYLPNVEMTLEKEPLFNYGLDLESFLDENTDKPSFLEKTIRPNESLHFYVVALSSKGVDGVVRAGLQLENQKLIYKINNQEIDSGQLSIK